MKKTAPVLGDISKDEREIMLRLLRMPPEHQKESQKPQSARAEAQRRRRERERQ
jgi:hypothetical protein